MKKLFLSLVVIYNIKLLSKQEETQINTGSMQQYGHSIGIYKVYPTVSDIEKAEKLVLNGIVIDKKLAYFLYIYPISIEDFYFYVIDNYIKCSDMCQEQELRDHYKSLLYDITPETLWCFLHNQNIFNDKFIEQINALYVYDDFILICKTRMVIEYLVFGLNISLKTMQYNFKYMKQFKLKALLYTLHEFISKHYHLLHNVGDKVVKEMKKLLSFYINTHEAIYIPKFLNEFSQFKNVLMGLISHNVHGRSGEPSAREKLSVCTRFSAIIAL